MTVSRVINGSPNVRPETRERVLKAIGELAYSPNAAARALNSRRSRNIGIIFPRKEYLLTAPFYVELSLELEGRLKKRGYHLFLGTLSSEEETSDPSSLFGEGKVDGLIIFAPAPGDQGVASLSAKGLPFVVVFGRPGETGFPFVDSDNSLGMGLLMEHLAGLGHRRIGFVTGAPSEPHSLDRLAQYRAGLDRAGLGFSSGLVAEGDWSLGSGYAAFRSLLGLPEPPSAIVFSNDQMAIGGIKAAHDLGVRIPEDVSITGYDDIQYASFLTPPLTTVRQDIGAVGEAAADLMLRRIEGLESPSLVLSPRLVVRESTSPPRADALHRP
jgi:LacI family transcriptional regulator